MRHAPGGFQKFLRGIQYVGAKAQQAFPRVSDHSFIEQPGGGGLGLRCGDRNERPARQASAENRDPLFS